MGKFIDLTGQRFGRLVVIERAPNSRTRLTRWLCRCDCGNMTTVYRGHLVGGLIKSCGCLLHDNKQLLTHGATGTRLWYIWRGMKERCRYAGHNHYHRYGGRGITLCEEWKTFETFRDWALSHGYADGLTLDRIDNDGSYSPDNCKFSTYKEQARNTSRTRRFQGKTLSEWAEITGFSRSLLATRIYSRKWTFERAISEPVHKRQ